MGGLERSAREHIDGLRDRGHEVILYTPIHGTPGKEELNVPWPSVPRRGQSLSAGAAYLIWTMRLRREMARRVQPGDVLHFHGGSVGALRGSSFLQEVPSVFNPHGAEEFGRLTLPTLATRPILRQMVREGGALATRVISTDRGMTEGLVQKLRIPAEKMVLIPNSVNVDRLHELASKGQLREKLPFSIVTVGRLESNKGYDVLAKALGVLSRQCQLPENWSWLHFGTGSQAPLITETLGALDLLPNFTLFTEAPDELVQQSVAAASLFIQPSRYEGSSITTLEAMSHGRVVVGTRTGGIPDKIQHGVTGFLAEPDNILSLSEAILGALKSDHVAIGASAQNLVQNNFSLENALNQYEQLYSELKA
jgi:glycosyltransferase involved in cell wall biosynthesis